MLKSAGVGCLMLDQRYPWVKINQCFSLCISVCLCISKLQKRTSIDPDKISGEIFPSSLTSCWEICFEF